jgi:hypothetical protein
MAGHLNISGQVESLPGLSIGSFGDEAPNQARNHAALAQG